MKNEMPHISIGQNLTDPFIFSSRSKTKEHTDRLRSELFESTNYENNQKSMKNEENIS